jgi:hypothetical protein
VTPDFGPGRGWHKFDGPWIPGCESDLIARRERAYRCWMLRLRDQDGRISAATLQACQPLEGGILLWSKPEGWEATLYVLPDMRVELLHLAGAELKREEADGCRQYAGFERNGRRAKWPQTWLCAPTRERLAQIVERMAEREWR